MTRGWVKKEINITLQKLQDDMVNFCEAEKEIFKIIDKIFDEDVYNYVQSHKCCIPECEPDCE